MGMAPPVVMSTKLVDSVAGSLVLRCPHCGRIHRHHLGDRDVPGVIGRRLEALCHGDFGQHAGYVLAWNGVVITCMPRARLVLDGRQRRIVCTLLRSYAITRLARDIGVDHSTLDRALSGQRVTRQTFLDLEGRAPDLADLIDAPSSTYWVQSRGWRDDSYDRIRAYIRGPDYLAAATPKEQ